MTAHTLAARETVREPETVAYACSVVEEIRASLSPIEQFTARELKLEYEAVVDELIRIAAEGKRDYYRVVELWARLAADIAGMIQQRSECPDCGRAHGDHHNSCAQVRP